MKTFKLSPSTVSDFSYKCVFLNLNLRFSKLIENLLLAHLSYIFNSLVVYGYIDIGLDMFELNKNIGKLP